MQKQNPLLNQNYGSRSLKWRSGDEKEPRSEKAQEEMFCKVARTPLQGLSAPRSFAKKSMNLQFRVMRLLCDTLKNIIDCLVPPVC